MLDEIRARRDEIYAIARKYKAEKLWGFGLCARKKDRPDSWIEKIKRLMAEGGASVRAGRTSYRLTHFVLVKTPSINYRI